MPRCKFEFEMEHTTVNDHWERTQTKRNSAPLVGFVCSCDWSNLRSEVERETKEKEGRRRGMATTQHGWLKGNEQAKICASETMREGKQWWAEGKEVRREVSGSGVTAAQRPKHRSYRPFAAAGGVCDKSCRVGCRGFHSQAAREPLLVAE